eukprot:Opistho-2@73829
MEVVAREQKEAFLVVFQRLVMALSDHIHKLDEANTADGAGLNDTATLEGDHWYRAVSGYMLSIGRKYHDAIKGFMLTLETLVFTDDVDPRILNTFNKIMALRQE